MDIVFVTKGLQEICCGILLDRKAKKNTSQKQETKGTKRLMCRKLNGHLPRYFLFCVCACSIFIVQDMLPRTGDVDHPLISIDHSHTYTCYIVSNLVLVCDGVWNLSLTRLEGWKGGSTAHARKKFG